MLPFSLVRLVTVGVPVGHFTHIFVDEAGQAVEPECMVAVAGECWAARSIPACFIFEGTAQIKRRKAKAYMVSPGRVPENIQKLSRVNVFHECLLRWFLYLSWWRE